MPTESVQAMNVMLCSDLVITSDSKTLFSLSLKVSAPGFPLVVLRCPQPMNASSLVM